MGQRRSTGSNGAIAVVVLGYHGRAVLSWFEAIRGAHRRLGLRGYPESPRANSGGGVPRYALCHSRLTIETPQGPVGLVICGGAESGVESHLAEFRIWIAVRH